MDHLMNSLDGEAKKSVKTVAPNGYFYAMALKVLKRYFGNPLTWVAFKIDQKQINIKDKLGLRLFHQQLHICISWLSSIGYDTPLNWYKNLVKTLSVLPIKYQSEHTKDFNMLDRTINLTTLEQWLERQLQIIFNPLANILAAEIKNNKQNEKQIKNQKLHNSLSKSSNAISGSPTRDNKKQSKTFPNKKFTCWACKNDIKLMFCDEFLNRDVSNRKQFVVDQKLCFNCLSKNHHVADCISEFTCRHKSCGKKHHTLLHEDTKSMPYSSSPANSNNVNTVQTAPQQKSINTDENPEIPLVVNKIKNTSSESSHVFLPVLPVKISNGNKSVTVKALFDSGSDSTLLAQDVASYLNLNGKEQSITFYNAISQKSKVKSKLVNFSLPSKLHSMRIKFENAWVVNELNLMPYKINQNFHKQFEHLKDIHFDTSSSDVSLLIEVDMPEWHLTNEIRKGNKNEPIGIKLVLGWVLLVENNK